MIKLVKPSVPEFEQFKSLAISIYIEELVKYREYSSKTAATQYAHEEVNGMLPLGLETPRQFILFAKNNRNETVGYLWYVTEPPEFTAVNQGFLAYLFVLPEHRKKGFASKIMDAWEERLKLEHDIFFGYFYVFRDNTPAINLYKKLGYKLQEDFGWADLSTTKRYFMAKRYEKS